MRVSRVRCEHTRMAKGIDLRTPRFSWSVEGEAGCEGQAAWQMLVSTTPENARAEIGDWWDSGMVPGAQSAMVPYAGPRLGEESDYYLRVRVRDAGGQVSPYCDPFPFSSAFFEASREVWDGLWLTSTEYSDISPMFRRVFDLSRPVARARAYIAGIGYYQMYLNGKRVGPRGLSPGWTDYQKRVLYDSFDVTELLLSGRNAVGVRLGDGWYISSFFKGPQFAMRMHIFFADGSDLWIDSSPRAEWRVSYDGEERQNSVYHGETIDATMRRPGWNTIFFDESAPSSGRWVMPLTAEPPGGLMKSAVLEGMEVVDGWTCASCRAVGEGAYVLDAGQNISGWVCARIAGRRGQRVTLRFSEDVGPDGDIRVANLRTARATDTYILSGEGEDLFEPAFTFHGFRYMRVEGLEQPPVLANWRFEVVRSAVETCGRFACGDETLNRIQDMCWWTEATNLMSVPTDCPQRDERLGWLNDMTARAEGALYNFGLGALYSKWLDDIADAQGPVTGAITDTAPFRGFGRQPADPVCSSYLLLPWYLYVCYGDKDALARHYAGMKKWVDYLAGQVDENGVLGYSYFGDWASPITGAVPDSNGCGAVSAITPGALMSTGYLYFDATLMARIARLLDRQEDARGFDALAEKTRADFLRAFYNPETGLFAGGSQGANAFALHLGLVPPERESALYAHLIADVKAHGGHFTTGNQCTKYLLDALSRCGAWDLAYDMVSTHEYPGWGYMLDHGASTVWERWEHVTEGPEIGMASLNHPMNAVVSVWFYKWLCGIRPDPEGPGYARFTIEPIFPRKLCCAEARCETVKGTIRAGWKREGSLLTLNIEVPYNSRATLLLPFPILRGAVERVQAGMTHKWAYQVPSGAYTLQCETIGEETPAKEVRA